MWLLGVVPTDAMLMARKTVFPMEVNAIIDLSPTAAAELRRIERELSHRIEDETMKLLSEPEAEPGRLRYGDVTQRCSFSFAQMSSKVGASTSRYASSRRRT